MKFNSIEQKEAVEEFDRYVSSGYYSAWYKDNVSSIGKKATDQKSKLIRQWHVDQFDALHDTFITKDGTIIDISPEFESGVSALVTGVVNRVMVGNHGVYVEFTSDEKNFKFKKSHLQYDEYLDFWNNKLYHQTKPVNYADYRSGHWYISLNDIVRQLNENAGRNPKQGCEAGF